MSVTALGDMAQQFTSLRNTTAIKTALADLSESVSTGQVTDLTATLNGETARFSGIRYTLAQLDGYLQIGAEARQTLGNVQIALNGVDAARSLTAERLLLVSDASTIGQIEEAATSARSTFADMVRTLNTQVGDRALLGGAAVNGPPLAEAAAMLADLTLAIGGATDAATIIATVDTWFDTPGGGFETTGYLGDTGPLVQKRISDTATTTFDARADDPALRAVLKGAAIAALAADLPAIDLPTQSALLQDAGQRLFVSASDLVGLQARVGFSEARLDETIAALTAQQTALGIAQNEIIQADPFETATQLQAVQLQLETHFSVTARLSQLSLVRYI